jgi:hypothetical protein
LLYWPLLVVVAGVFVLTRPPNLDILLRKASPDHVLDAVDAMPRTGATVGFVHWVYITKAGGARAGDPIFVADKVDGGISLTWRTDSELAIGAKSARVFKSEAAVIRLPNGATRQVAIKLEIDDLRTP